MHQGVCIFYAPIGDSQKLLVFWSTRWSQKDAKFTIHTVIAGVSEISIFWEVFRFIKKYLTSGAESYIGELKSQFSMLNLTSLMGNGFYWQFFWSTVFSSYSMKLLAIPIIISSVRESSNLYEITNQSTITRKERVFKLLEVCFSWFAA